MCCRTTCERVLTVLAMFIWLARAVGDEPRSPFPDRLRQSTSWETTAEEERLILADEPFLSAGMPGARITARLGAVLLVRDSPASEYLVFNPVTGANLLNPGDLNFPVQGGVDAGLVWHGAVADLEFRYFGIEQASASLGPIVSPDGADLNIPDSAPLPGPVALGLQGASSLQSFELNLRRNVSPRLTLLAGLRYVSFRDAMRLDVGEPGLDPAESILFGTGNDLYGLQIGADGILWQPSSRFRIEGAIKAGVYANGARSSISGDDGDTGEKFRFQIGRDRTSFVGDLNLVGVYQLNPRWAVRAGYQMLWLSSVAVGSMQFHNFDAGLITNTSATVFFHGALVGLERRW